MSFLYQIRAIHLNLELTDKNELKFNRNFKVYKLYINMGIK